MHHLLWIRRALDLIYPRNCPVCQHELSDEESGVVCSACLLQIRYISSPWCEKCGLPFEGRSDGNFQCSYCASLRFHFTGVTAAARFSGALQKMIIDWKFNHAFYLEETLKKSFVTGIRERIPGENFAGIIPVPLYPARERERGFNQARILARALGEFTGLPVLSRVLKRTRPTQVQSLLDREARWSNLKGAFEVVSEEEIRGKNWVLVDDVFTTGATTNECAKTLLHKGASIVHVICLARG